jgi:hypothetical protein
MRFGAIGSFWWEAIDAIWNTRIEQHQHPLSSTAAARQESSAPRHSKGNSIPWTTRDTGILTCRQRLRTPPYRWHPVRRSLPITGCPFSATPGYRGRPEAGVVGRRTHCLPPRISRRWWVGIISLGGGSRRNAISGRVEFTGRSPRVQTRPIRRVRASRGAAPRNACDSMRRGSSDYVGTRGLSSGLVCRASRTPNCVGERAYTRLRSS